MSAQKTTNDSARAAGWFADPLDEGRIRYWNGDGWTDQTSARVDLPPPVGAPQPAPVSAQSPAVAATPTTPGPGTPPGAVTPMGVKDPAAMHAANGGAQANYAQANYPYGSTQYGNGAGYQSAGYSGAGYQGSTYPNSSRGPAGRSGKAKRGRNGSGSVGLRANMFTTAAVVLGVLALIFMPLYVGVLAIASAAVAIVRGERRAATGLKVAIIGMVIGLAWAYASARFGLVI